MSRKFFSRAALIAGGGILALTALAALDGVSLQHKPKVGDTAKFSVNASFEIDQGTVLFSQTRSDKVTDVKADGTYTMITKTNDTKISLGGMDIPGSPDTEDTAEFGPDGVARSFSSNAPLNSFSYRIANLEAFKAPADPVKVGDEIKYEIPADTKKDTPAVKAVYKVEALEKVKDWDTVKLSFKVEETSGMTPASIKGTSWVSTADGSMVKSEQVWKDVQPDGAPSPVSGKYTIERTK